MIARKHRFHGHNSLRYAYQNGTTVRGPLVSLRYALNYRRQTYRLAVVVSTKVSKSAVRRNRIRRRIYETARGLEGNITEPYDLVITVFHEQIADIPAPELEKLIRAQFKQAGLIGSPKSKVQS